MSSAKHKKNDHNGSKPQKSQSTKTARLVDVVLGLIMILGVLSTAIGGRFIARQGSNPTPNATIDAQSLGTVVLTWKREGGIGGTCDELLVTLGGQVNAENCSGGKPTLIGTQDLTQEQIAQLQAWISNYQAFSIAPSGTPVPDGFDLHLSFYGSGTETIDETGLQQIEHLAETVFATLSGEPTPDATG